MCPEAPVAWACMGHAALGPARALIALTLLVAIASSIPPSARAAPDTPTPVPTSVTPTSVTPTPAAASSDTAAQAPPTDPGATTDAFRDREDRLALMLSRARVGAGLLPLARSPALDRAAVAHAHDMVARGYMEHEAPDGSTPATRAAQEGYETPPGSAWLVVETISAISDEPDGALDWWLSDGLHRRVVLRSTWREIGVGFAPGGPYGRFWVGLFGCRPNVLPPVLLDGVLAVPDESCSHGGDAFGPVQSVRVAETSAAAQSLDWQPYTPQQAWPAGHTAVVDVRDAAGHELEARAADPTGAPTLAP
jgi:uncharacterized protein YkwD